MRRQRIGAFDASLETHVIAGDAIALWRVADLERHVDRAALLATPADGAEPREPPYWAHLWSGALVLAAAVPAHPARVVELGCGLGLPGLVAARRGGRVVFVDRAPEALAFVRASAEANGLERPGCCAADFTTPVLRARFDLVLAAEVLYDREAFPAVAAALAGLLGPGGRVLLTDAGRIDTQAFYELLGPLGLRWTEHTETVREDGFAVRVRLVELGHAADAGLVGLPAARGPG